MVENDWLVSYLALQNTGSEEVVWEFEMPPTGTDNIQVFAHSVEFAPEQGHDVTWVKNHPFFMFTGQKHQQCLMSTFLI